jgi:hypothetical protein
MSDQVADVLDDAADWLERNGWSQGIGGGSNCALGALIHVAADLFENQLAVDALVAVLELPYGFAVAQWNDDPARTKQQVLDAFRAAAKQERMDPETPAPPRTPERDGAGTGLAGGDAETRTRPADESPPPPVREVWKPR